MRIPCFANALGARALGTRSASGPYRSSTTNQHTGRLNSNCVSWNQFHLADRRALMSTETERPPTSGHAEIGRLGRVEQQLTWPSRVGQNQLDAQAASANPAPLGAQCRAKLRIIRGTGSVAPVPPSPEPAMTRITCRLLLVATLLLAGTAGAQAPERIVFAIGRRRRSTAASTRPSRKASTRSTASMSRSRWAGHRSTGCNC